MDYPIPNRKQPEPGDVRIDEYNKEIETGAVSGTFADGRPYLCEGWFDCELRIQFRSFFYSTLGIEDWDAAKHLELATKEDLLKGQHKEFIGQTPGITKLQDDSNNEIWSVSYAISEED